METLATVPSQLNLARKWRSQSFDQIIGQELVVRSLKNSLYLNHLFPVYLFSGQRGCGKTTTARVFTAAVNCQRLSDFQNDPRSCTIPCQSCESCRLMASGKHPDFMEIDAASHTGVDNVRNIIESAALLPVVGRRRIYLIDEAHMLSKAAFNAFLKVLEEPPASVLFILATTDPQKVLETVRSRCFQLFFGTIETPILLSHLQQICIAEQIGAEPAALELIIQETDGCARDAINLLERVRFSGKRVTVAVVTNALGYPEQQQLERLLTCLLLAVDPAELLQLLAEINLPRYAPDALWKRLLNLLRQAWRIKFNLPVAGVTPAFQAALANCALERLVLVLDAFCVQEPLFMRSAYPQLSLELFLLATLKKKV